MLDHEAGIGLVAQYLSLHRSDPPERDGWFPLYEIQQGIHSELGVKVRPIQVTTATKFLLDTVPPTIEDAWFMGDKEGNPILNERFIHPDMPDGARRFYRALGGAASYRATVATAEPRRGRLRVRWV